VDLYGSLKKGVGLEGMKAEKHFFFCAFCAEQSNSYCGTSLRLKFQLRVKKLTDDVRL